MDQTRELIIISESKPEGSWQSRFNPMSVHVVSVMDKVVLGQVFSEYFWFHLRIIISLNASFLS
jgi:hypothetical protein